MQAISLYFLKKPIQTKVQKGGGVKNMKFETNKEKGNTSLGMPISEINNKSTLNINDQMSKYKVAK